MKEGDKVKWRQSNGERHTGTLLALAEEKSPHPDQHLIILENHKDVSPVVAVNANLVVPIDSDATEAAPKETEETE